MGDSLRKILFFWNCSPPKYGVGQGKAMLGARRQRMVVTQSRLTYRRPEYRLALAAEGHHETRQTPHRHRLCHQQRAGGAGILAERDRPAVRSHAADPPGLQAAPPRSLRLDPEDQPSL